MRPVHPSFLRERGFVLVMALLLMLFAGVVVINSAQKTGTEMRAAQSEAHIATLQAAAEAGIHRFNRKAFDAVEQDTQCAASEASACECVRDAAENNLADFLGQSGRGDSKSNAVFFTGEEGDNVYWFLNEEDMIYCDANNSVRIYSVAFVGEPSSVIARLTVSANMAFVSSDTGQSGQNGRLPNDVLPQDLIDALGRFADYTVAVGGSFTANGSRSYDGIVGSGGPMTLNGGQTINGNSDYSEEAEVISDWATMPDPRSESPGHPHFTGYIDKIAARASEEDDVISTCDLSSINSSNSSGKRYVYCNGSFSSQGNRGTLHADLDGLILVAEGNFDGRLGASINTSIVTGGTVNIQGSGNNILKSGVVWSAGSVSISGGPDFQNLGLVTNSALTINGSGSHAGPESSEGAFVPSAEIQFDY